MCYQLSEFIWFDSGSAMIYLAVEVIWIFLADGTARAVIEGTLRSPRGPKKTEFIALQDFLTTKCNNFPYMASSASYQNVRRWF